MKQKGIPVVLDNKVILYLNSDLIKRLHLTPEDVTKIKNLHIFKHIIFEKMRSCDEALLPLWNNYVLHYECALQRACGFPEDSSYHKHWLTPRCCCPSLDNIDDYGYRSAYSAACPVHKYLIKEGVS